MRSDPNTQSTESTHNCVSRCTGISSRLCRFVVGCVVWLFRVTVGRLAVRVGKTVTAWLELFFLLALVGYFVYYGYLSQAHVYLNEASTQITQTVVFTTLDKYVQTGKELWRNVTRPGLGPF